MIPFHRYAAAAALLFLCLGGQPTAASPKLLVDLSDGSVLYSEDAAASWFPASVTKLMTASLALDAIASGRVSPGFPIVMTRHAASLPPSRLGLPPGEALRLEDALRITLTRSMNDVATAIGENLAGSEPAFVALMNAEAVRLGMHGTRFTNPSGLPDPQQVSTAQDLAILASHILTTHPDKAWLFSLPQVDVPGRTYRNTNGLIGTYEGAAGMKTGYICSSGFNVVSVAKRGGRRLLAVVLGAPSARRRERAAAALLDFGFSGAPAIGKLASEAVSPTKATDLRPFGCGRTWNGFTESLARTSVTAAAQENPPAVKAATRRIRRF